MDGSIEVDGNTIATRFVQKPWIRNSYLRFEDERLVVVSRSERMMHRVISKHRDWIARHYKEIKSTIRLFDSGSVLHGSNRYKVRHVIHAGRPKADIAGDTLMLYARDSRGAERLIDRITREDTQRIAPGMARSKASLIGAEVKEVKVRKYRKWGACSSEGRITINYCISMLPAELQEYIISHEVAHLKQLNHSGRFWSVVESLCPDYKALRKQLRSYDNRRRAVYVPDLDLNLA
jgi:hypothetical protein